MPFIDVFYHQSSERHPGHTARAPPIMHGGRVRTGDRTTASPMPWPLGHDIPIIPILDLILWTRQRRAYPAPPGRAVWVRSPPTPTHKTCLPSAVGDLKWSLVSPSLFFVLRSHFVSFCWFFICLLFFSLFPKLLYCYHHFLYCSHHQPAIRKIYWHIKTDFKSNRNKTSNKKKSKQNLGKTSLKIHQSIKCKSKR